MPSLSTTFIAVPVFPAASVTDTPMVSALPGADGTVARQVPACAVPFVRVAATPFTSTALAPTTSLTCTVTSAVGAVSIASAEGDVTATSGGVVSCTVTVIPVDAVSWPSSTVSAIACDPIESCTASVAPVPSAIAPSLQV